MIYSYLLASDEQFFPNHLYPSGTWPGIYTGFGYRLSPALVQTCKSISQEALPILYGNNTFSLKEHWLTNFPHPYRQLITQSIRHLVIDDITAVQDRGCLWVEEYDLALVKKVRTCLPGITKLGFLIWFRYPYDGFVHKRSLFLSVL